MRGPTGNELKREIRTACPELKHRDLSVKNDGSYNIELKAFFPLSRVKAVAEKNESIDRCQYSGEILSGGNTFVFVGYVYKIEVPQTAMDAVEKLLPRFNGESWKSDNLGGGTASKNYHLSNALKEEGGFFAEWTKDDIIKGLHAMRSCEKLQDWYKF